MNKKGKDCMPSTVKRSMAIVLTVMMIISTFLSSGNLVYAVGDGEMVLESASYVGVGNAIINERDVTFTVPFDYIGDTLDLSGVNYVLVTGYKLGEFDRNSSAIIGGDSVTIYIPYYIGVDVENTYTTHYNIRVEREEPPKPSTFSGTISMKTTVKTDIGLNNSDFTKLYTKNDGKEMGFITINPASGTIGRLKYAGSNSSYEPNTKISVSDIDSLAYEPPASTIGTASYTVTAYDSDGTKVTGNAALSIKVEYPSAPDVKFSTNQDTVLKVSSTGFVNASNTAVGGTFDHISFDSLPPSSNGSLYIDYVSSTNKGTAVEAGKNYTKAELDRMSFVPNGLYFGKFNIAYKGYNTTGDMFTGKVEVTVIEKVIVIEKIKYSAYVNTAINFDAADFEDVFLDGTGQRLSYVKFTLPSSSRGILYSSYGLSGQSKVSASSKCYDDDIDEISFVPYTNYSGTVAITYTGFNSRGESYTGEIEIQMIKLVTDAGDVIYKTGSYTPVDFDYDDFADECWDVTREDLDFVKFSIPSSTYGTMYYKYDTRSQAKVSSTTKYYDDDLDDITFVPNPSYIGTVVITYKGYNIDDEDYTGAVKITVTKEVPVAGDIKISTKEDVAIKFDDEDFNDACEDATGEELDYVTFTLPSSRNGKLYYNYTSPTKYDSEVTASRKYYYDDTPSIYRITFVPYKDYYGTVTIKYTGYNIDGVSFTGSVKVEVVSMPETEGSLYFKDVTRDYSWAASYIDYLAENGVVSGTGNNNYSPAQNVTRGDFMLMLYRALDLTATVRGNFSDVPKDSYYYNAIAVAKSLGIAKGDGDKFMPSAGITREDAMALVDRALIIEGKRLTAGKAIDLIAFKDRNSVSDYAVTSVATLVKAGIIQGNNSYLYPKSMISRAEMAVILYKVLQLD
ncbi:MAG: S-layer homology domain-containing protein [Sedimentibacter sp.]|nr:S-layer homology domain-containing protein [Sedimentibacter sp.]